MSIFRRIFRPGSGGPAKGISIVDTPQSRAHTPRSGITRMQREESDPESSFYPMIITNEISVLGEQIPKGLLPGVDKEGNIPSYEPDDPQVVKRLFGIDMPDE